MRFEFAAQMSPHPSHTNTASCTSQCRYVPLYIKYTHTMLSVSSYTNIRAQTPATCLAVDSHSHEFPQTKQETEQARQAEQLAKM